MVTEPHLETHPVSTMVSDSSSSTTIPSTFSIPIAKKITKSNYRLWRAQIMSLIWAAQMEDLLIGDDVMPAKTIRVKTGDTTTDKPNPEYTHWLTYDQALLGYILSSLTREVVMGVTHHLGRSL
jgi:hypothetical protein